MIDLIVITRLFVDYLWQFKSLSVAHALASTFILLYFYFKSKKTRIRICSTDYYLIALLAFSTISLINSINQNTLIEYSKILTYGAFYAIGRNLKFNPQRHRTLAKTCALAIILFGFMAITGYGYQQWGTVTTFTGGYFFKTDMALAILILLAMTAPLSDNKHLYLSLSAISFYIIFKTNARVALPLALIIPAITIALSNQINLKIKTKHMIYVGLALSTGISIFAIVDFESLGLLNFDFSDPFSEENTQGRNVIWGVILSKFMAGSMYGKLFGYGLDADLVATGSVAQLIGLRAHNSYIYLLVCTGVIGSMAFYAFLISATRKAKQTFNSKSKIINIQFIIILLTFLWISLTTEAIIRPQMMIYLFLFAGLSVQLTEKSKQDKNRSDLPVV